MDHELVGIGSVHQTMIESDGEIGHRLDGDGVVALGIGTVLAPFTGGASLVYAAVTLGCYAAVDVATKDQSVDK